MSSLLELIALSLPSQLKFPLFSESLKDFRNALAEHRGVKKSGGNAEYLQSETGSA